MVARILAVQATGESLWATGLSTHIDGARAYARLPPPGGIAMKAELKTLAALIGSALLLSGCSSSEPPATEAAAPAATESEAAPAAEAAPEESSAEPAAAEPAAAEEAPAAAPAPAPAPAADPDVASWRVIEHQVNYPNR
jgi:pyruvate/2-oxoglutarate dehydrogenase complex dihydrolipoamide acyltransferase (E2) component